MLTKETLLANEALSGLTEEQIATIETLSKNDENQVVGARFGEVYRQLDATIENSLGIKRNGDEKTYLYLERAAKEFSGKYGDYDTLKSELEELKAKGADDATKRELEAVRKEYDTLKADYETEKANHTKALSEYKIDNEIARAIEGIQLKSGMNDVVIATLKAKAISNIKAMKPSFEERDGGERLLFHKEDGTPMLNSENQLNPYTAKELLIKEFEALDILDKKPAKGAGGKQTQGKTDILGATTKREAIEAATKMVLEMGIPKTSPKFQGELERILEANNVKSLK